MSRSDSLKHFPVRLIYLSGEKVDLQVSSEKLTTYVSYEGTIFQFRSTSPSLAKDYGRRRQNYLEVDPTVMLRPTEIP